MCGFLAVAACSRPDPRFQKLTIGIPKDSAVRVIGVEKPNRIDPYLVNGHYLEAMYFAPPDANSALTDREMTPMVIIDGVLTAWGWKKWDSIATANKIIVQKEQ